VTHEERRARAIAWAGEAWCRSCWLGGVSPQTASYWYIDGRPDLSYWPFAIREEER
jgi:hypothetical protein